MELGSSILGETLVSAETATAGYCSQDDLENRIGKAYLGQLTNDNIVLGGDYSAQAANADVVTFLINKADRYIDNELNGVYAVPFQNSPNSPETINRLSIDLTIYFAMERKFSSMNIPDEWKKAKDDADTQLDRLASMENVLDEVVPTYAASAITVPTTSPIVDFNDSDNAISYY